MSDFLIYVLIGLKHVLDINSYDHVLFLIALTVPHTFKDWKRILFLITVFTVGHTLALLLSVFQILTIRESLVELLIPITILVTATCNFFSVGKSKKSDSFNNSVVFITLFFGVIHGLGFSNYFKTLLPGNPSDKVIPLLEFALGIEFAQLAVVLLILILSYCTQTFFRISRRDFVIVTSAFIIGVALPMILQNDIWT